MSTRRNERFETADDAVQAEYERMYGATADDATDDEADEDVGEKCSECNGTGKDEDGDECLNCGGTGFEPDADDEDGDPEDSEKENEIEDEY